MLYKGSKIKWPVVFVNPTEAIVRCLVLCHSFGNFLYMNGLNHNVKLKKFQYLLYALNLETGQFILPTLYLCTLPDKEWDNITKNSLTQETELDNLVTMLLQVFTLVEIFLLCNCHDEQNFDLLCTARGWRKNEAKTRFENGSQTQRQ